MKYELNDQFYIGALPVKVVFINNTSAWLAPLEDERLPSGEMIFKNCSMYVLDKRGRTKEGLKAIYIKKTDCMAV